MKNVVLHVTGMSCGHCVQSVEGALSKIEGIDKAKVDLEAKNVSVIYNEEKVSVDQMKEAIEEQGYEVE